MCIYLRTYLPNVILIKFEMTEPWAFSDQVEEWLPNKNKMSSELHEVRETDLKILQNMLLLFILF